MNRDMSGIKKRIVFEFFANMGERILGMSRRTKLTTVAWVGIAIAQLGIWEMFGLGLALFSFGAFVTIVALVSIDAEIKKKKNEKV